MTREEKNRKIAEWIGDLRGYSCQMKPLDFFTDEAANALALEKLCAHFPYFSITFQKERIEIEASGVVGGFAFEYEMDRKTAIAEAALKLIEKPKEPSK